MKGRKISTRQLDILVPAIAKHVPDIRKHINDHRWFMGEHLCYDVGETVAVFDYFLHHLKPFEEGYSVCFIDYVPEGLTSVPVEEGPSCEGGCPKVFELIRLQRPVLLEQFSQHQWYLGQQLHRPVEEKEAEGAFRDSEYFLQWADGFRTCYEERVCPLRSNCKSNSKLERVVV
jgi:hypothetical protein